MLSGLKEFGFHMTYFVLLIINDELFVISLAISIMIYITHFIALKRDQRHFTTVYIGY